MILIGGHLVLTSLINDFIHHIRLSWIVCVTFIKTGYVPSCLDRELNRTRDTIIIMLQILSKKGLLTCYLVLLFSFIKPIRRPRNLRLLTFYPFPRPQDDPSRRNGSLVILRTSGRWIGQRVKWSGESSGRTPEDPLRRLTESRRLSGSHTETTVLYGLVVLVLRKEKETVESSNTAIRVMWFMFNIWLGVTRPPSTQSSLK